MPNFLKDNRTIVGCDLDDVLANFIKPFMTIAKRKFNIDPEVLPDSWDWTGTKFLDGSLVSKDQMGAIVDSVWDDIINTPKFWETLEIMPGVDPNLVNLLDYRTKLYFPTARAITADGVDVGRQSATWLRKNFLIAFPTVFVSMEKGLLAAALKYDYFIDDRPSNCQAIKSANPNCKVFLQNASHNQSFNDPIFPRVYTVNEFAEIALRGE